MPNRTNIEPMKRASPSMVDRAVVAEHAREGERDFEEFFRREHVRLFGALPLVSGDREEAMELMQDAFLSMWRRWEKAPRIEDPTAYLFRTAMNAFRMRRRHARVVARRWLRPSEPADPI